MTDMQASTPAPTIVRATEEHLDRVTPLFLAYCAFYGRTVAPEAAVEYLREGLATGESVIFVAFTQTPSGMDEAGGFLQMHPSRSSKLLGRRWIVNDLYVAPALRRQHVGRHLLEAAHAHARATHAKDLRLSTKVTNQAARAFYASLGWVALDEFVTYELRVAADEREPLM